MYSPFPQRWRESRALSLCLHIPTASQSPLDNDWGDKPCRKHLEEKRKKKKKNSELEVQMLPSRNRPLRLQDQTMISLAESPSSRFIYFNLYLKSKYQKILGNSCTSFLLFLAPSLPLPLDSSFQLLYNRVKGSH